MTANLAPTLWVRVSQLPSSGDYMQIDVPIDECAGHWLFTKQLLPALFAATDASPTREKARVVTVSSSANYFATEIDFEAIGDGPKRRKINAWGLYNRSKLVGALDNFFILILMLTN